MPLLSRSRGLFSKIESSYGTSSNPGTGDAVLCRSIEVVPIESETLNRELIRSYYGNSDVLLSNTRVSITIETEFQSSGTAATASRLDSLIRACGFTVSNVASAVTGTAQAGSANSITLASGASATDDIYVGHRIEITGGTGDEHVGLILGYNGTTKVCSVVASSASFVPGASSTYSIAAGNKYSPVSSSFESCTIKFNNSGVQHLCTGCRGSFSIGLSTDCLLYTNPSPRDHSTARMPSCA